MRTALLTFTGAFLLLAAASAPGQEVEVERLKAHVEHLASPELEGRGNDTPGSRAAQEYIVRHFQEAGLQPAFGDGGWRQPFESPGWLEIRGSARGTNVVGILPGSDPALRDEVIVLGAHYDHLGIVEGTLYPGATDNAAGVAAVLELARVLGAGPRPARSVLFAAWDAEEDGLVGSHYFTKHPSFPLENAVCYFDMDLIGGDFLDLFPRKLLLIGTEHAPTLQGAVTRVSASRQIDLDLELLGADLVGPRCDFWNFRAAGVPFIFFTSGEHDAYHKPWDTADRVSYPKLLETARLVQGMTEELAHPEAPRPGFLESPIYSPEEARVMARLLSHIVDRSNMGTIETFTWRQGIRQLRRMGERTALRPSDRRLMQVMAAATLVRRWIRPYAE